MSFLFWGTWKQGQDEDEQVRHRGSKFKEMFTPRWGSCTVDPESDASFLESWPGRGDGRAGGP